MAAGMRLSRCQKGMEHHEGMTLGINRVAHHVIVQYPAVQSKPG